MRNLIEFLERPDVREYISRYSRSPAVQAVLADYDPLWLTWWQYSRLYDAKWADQMFKELRWSLRSFQNPFQDLSVMKLARPSRSFMDENDLYINTPSFLPADAIDPTQRPPDWLDYAMDHAWRSDWLPILLIVRLYPNCSPNDLDQFPNIRPPFPVIFDTRLPATFCKKPKDAHNPLVGGVSAGNQQDSCTLGGVLADNYGNYYGLTCSHLMQDLNDPAQPNPNNCDILYTAPPQNFKLTYQGCAAPAAIEQPSQFDNQTFARWIGDGVVRSCLDAVPLGFQVDPLQPASQANDIDALLIRMDPAAANSSLSILNLGPIQAGTTPAKQLSRTQNVTIAGKESNMKSLYIGPAVSVIKFPIGSQEYVMRNLVSLESYSTALGNYTISPKPVFPGDSGAWVCNPSGSQYGWYGMVIATDNISAYALYSEAVEAWLQSIPPQYGIQPLRIV